MSGGSSIFDLITLSFLILIVLPSLQQDLRNYPSNQTALGDENSGSLWCWRILKSSTKNYPRKSLCKGWLVCRRELEQSKEAYRVAAIARVSNYDWGKPSVSHGSLLQFLGMAKEFLESTESHLMNFRLELIQHHWHHFLTRPLLRPSTPRQPPLGPSLHARHGRTVLKDRDTWKIGTISFYS